MILILGHFRINVDRHEINCKIRLNLELGQLRPNFVSTMVWHRYD